MPNKIYIYLLLIFLFCFIPLYKSEDEIQNNTTQTNEEQSDSPLNKLNYTNIIYLDDSNYTKELNKSDLTYLLFYSSTSNSCIEFMPIFIETANYCKEKQLNILFARIEMDPNPKSSDEYEVYYYPTIILIIKGRRYTFEGKKTKDRLLLFMKKKLEGDIFEINKLDEIYENIDKSPLVFLSTVKDTSSIIYKSYLEYAQNNDKYDYYSCISEECFKKYGEDIVLFKDFDEKENSYTKDYGKLSEANENSFNDFISIFGVECGAFLTIPQIITLDEYGKKAIIYVRNPIDEQTKYDILFKQLGKELRKNNTYTFVSDTGEKGMTNIKVAFSIIPEELPSIFYYMIDNNDPIAQVKIFSKRKVDMKKVSIDSIKKFMKEVDDGKIKRDLFSEPPSESKVVEGLKYVIGRTYDKDVREEKKNVFLAVVEDDEDKDEDKQFLNILRNISYKYEDISFAYININKNEPRDFFARNDDLPIAYLYTNAMDEKQIIKYVPKNFTDISEEEVIMFLDENIRKIKREENIKVEKPKKENVQITDL